MPQSVQFFPFDSSRYPSRCPACSHPAYQSIRQLDAPKADFGLLSAGKTRGLQPKDRGVASFGPDVAAAINLHLPTHFVRPRIEHPISLLPSIQSFSYRSTDGASIVWKDVCARSEFSSLWSARRVLSPDALLLLYRVRYRSGAYFEL
jgi:hypothetical protein